MIRHLPLALALSLPLHAAEPSFEWLAFGGGVKNDKIRAVTLDREGNALLAGEATGEVAFAGKKYQGAGAMDVVVAKVGVDGAVQWLSGFGGSLTDRAYGVVSDAAGNVYITGHYESTDAVVAGEPLLNAGGYDIYVAKYSPTGDLLWLRTAGGAGYDYGHGIAVDGKGDVVVSGAVLGEARFGSTVVNAGSTSRAVFCAKYDADGQLKWVRASEGRVYGSGHGVAVDGQGCIYIGGNGSGSGKIGSHVLELGARSSLVIKLTSDGEPVWVASHPGPGFHEITVDAAGRVWGAGMFKDSATVGGETFKSTGPKDSDGILCHYNIEGKLQWARVLSGPGTDYCLGVATDGTGRAFVTGEYTATATFAGRTLNSRGATDIYVAAFDEAGQLEWLIDNGGPKGDNAYTIVWHPSGRLVIGGSCNAGAEFGKQVMDGTGGYEAYGAVLRLPAAKAGR
jgi:hypothetical protein